MFDHTTSGLNGFNEFGNVLCTMQLLICYCIVLYEDF